MKIHQHGKVCSNETSQNKVWGKQKEKKKRWITTGEQQEQKKDDMASSQWVATLLQTLGLSSFPFILTKRAGTGTAKPELSVDCWEIKQMVEDQYDAAAWSLFVEDKCCTGNSNSLSLSLRKGIDPAASNRTKNGLVVALLPCAVGISCWSGTPGDPKGATPGCWKISPRRPTSIRGLLAWSGI